MVLVLCAISAKRIFGPYRKYYTTDYRKYYFQQDGTTTHKANMVQEWLGDHLSTKFIDKKKWPPRSPDLNPCDFYLWGYLKSVVYNPLPKTLDELKENIE